MNIGTDVHKPAVVWYDRLYTYLYNITYLQVLVLNSEWFKSISINQGECDGLVLVVFNMMNLNAIE